jgi:DNA-binding response OmpR family regulator
MAKTILIIEDDAGINDMLRVLLQQNGYRTVSAVTNAHSSGLFLIGCFHGIV